MLARIYLRQLANRLLKNQILSIKTFAEITDQLSCLCYGIFSLWRMFEDCSEECNFCIVHEYGVYILNVIGFLALSISLIIYRRELVSWCRGESKPMKAQTNSLNATNTSIYQTLPINANQTPIMVPMSPNYRQQPVIVHPPPIVVRPNSPKSPKVIRQSRVPFPFAQASPPDAPSQQVNSPESPNQPLSTSQAPTDIDLFKLPTIASLTKTAIDAHESTGSNYYKQITKGKKPVASISQYLLRKNHGKKDNKKHHHRHHKDKKNVQTKNLQTKN